MQRAQALVVDRDPTVRAIVRDVLEACGVTTLAASTAGDGQDSLRKHSVRLLLVDLDDPGVISLGLVQSSLGLSHPPVVVAMSNDHDPSRVKQWMGEGIHEILSKPIDPTRTHQAAERALRQAELCDELRQLRHELQSREGYYQLIGRSAPMERVRQQLERLSASPHSVWFVGPSGSGKELAARTLHHSSARGDDPFVVIDGASLSAANWQSPAGLDDPTRGSLYLENVDAMPETIQEELSQCIARGVGPYGNGVRLFAGSEMAPATALDSGRLLDRLHTGLGTETVEMPALRERVEDVMLLARHFVARIREINHLPAIEISPEAADVLEAYGWPGNVQELRNTIEHAVILASDGTIRPRDLPERVRETKARRIAGFDPSRMAARKFRDVKREVVEAFERAYLAELLRRFGGNVTSASQQAGMLRSALQRLLRKYGLKSAEFRSGQASAAAEKESHRRPS